MQKVVMGLSGGMDSATVLGYYYDKKYQIYPLFFNYGSKHNQYEFKSALKLSEYFHTDPLKIINLDFIGNLFKSNLLQGQGEIPEGHYNDDNMSLTVVPGRNSIFISIMVGYAESVGADTIAVGTHMGDHSIYPDCRPIFISAMNTAIQASTEEKVHIETPIQHFDKSGILKMGYSFDIPVPYELSRTCYKDQEFSCGKCGSCRERLEAFEIIGRTDPIKYQE
ncbi:MAG: 7-cyano-7-deazaguanine synthase QueC [Clostridia bacterium]